MGDEQNFVRSAALGCIKGPFGASKSEIPDEVLASVRNWGDWDWEGAEEAFLRAIDLDPGNSQVRATYSMYLTMMRRFDEAIVQMEEAMQLSPLAPWSPSLHVSNLLFMKRYEEGVELARSVLDDVPNNVPALTALTDCLYLLGSVRRGARSATNASGVIGRPGDRGGP